MEARYNCCKVIHKSLMLSSRISADPAFAGIAAKVRNQTFLYLQCACVCVCFPRVCMPRINKENIVTLGCLKLSRISE